MIPLPWIHVFAVVLLLVCSAGGAEPPTAATSTAKVFMAKRVWTGRGDPIDDAVVVVVDGKIIAVGPRASTAIPTNAETHDLGDQTVIPGLVVAQTSLADTNADVERALTPQVTAIDGFDFHKERSSALSGGVTTVQVSAGTNRLMPGQGSVVKLGGSSRATRTLRERESLRVVLAKGSRTPPSIFEPPIGAVSVDRPLLPTRPQIGKTLGGAISGLRPLFRAAHGMAGSTNGDPVMNALTAHLTANGVVRITANTSREIRLAFNLAREFDLNLVLVDPSEFDEFREQHPQFGTKLDTKRGTKLGGVILEGLTPGQLSNPSPEDTEAQSPWESARELIDAGIPFAVRPASDADLVDFLFVGGQFRQDGLSVQEALNAITLWPARLMGVDDRVGTLAVGMDADFVVLSDEPFATQGHVMETYIDGEKVYDRLAVDETTVITAGTLYTGDGRVLENASLLVKGGTVRGVGSVSAPPNSKIRSYPDAVIVPGYVDLGAALSASGSEGGPDGGSDDTSGEGDSSATLGAELLTADPAVAIARQGGVTTVLIPTSGGASSSLLAFKLGDGPRVISDLVAMRFRLDENLAASVPALRRTLEEGRSYNESWRRYEVDIVAYREREKIRKREGERERLRRERVGESDEDAAESKEPDEEEEKDEEPEEPRWRENLEPYRKLFAGKIPAFVEARRSDAIEAALELFRDEFNVRTVLVGVDDLARFPDLLHGYDVSVCAGPSLMVTRDNRRTNLPQLLANERVPFGFQSRASTGVRDLARVVQFAVHRGLSSKDALDGLTGTAAKLLSDDLSFGSLRPGNDADLVVLSGPPFELSTRVLAVMIDGKWVHEVENER